MERRVRIKRGTRSQLSAFEGMCGCKHFLLTCCKQCRTHFIKFCDNGGVLLAKYMYMVYQWHTYQICINSLPV